MLENSSISSKSSQVTNNQFPIVTRFEVKNPKNASDKFDSNLTINYFDLFVDKANQQKEEFLKASTQPKKQIGLCTSTVKDTLNDLHIQFKFLEEEFLKLRTSHSERAETNQIQSFTVCEKLLDTNISNFKMITPLIKSLFNHINTTEKTEGSKLFREEMADLWCSTVHSQHKLELEKQYFKKKFPLLSQMNSLQKELEDKITFFNNYQKNPDMFELGYFNNSIRADQKDLFRTHLIKQKTDFIELHKRIAEFEKQFKIHLIQFKALNKNIDDMHHRILIAMENQVQVNMHVLLFSKTFDAIEQDERKLYAELVEKWNIISAMHLSLRKFLAKFDSALKDANLIVPWERYIVLEDALTLEYKPSDTYALTQSTA